MAQLTADCPKNDRHPTGPFSNWSIVAFVDRKSAYFQAQKLIKVRRLYLDTTPEKGETDYLSKTRKLFYKRYVSRLQ